MAKKFRELHSFAAYICENRERYQVDEGYQDGYYPYLKMVAKQEKFVKHIPPSQMCIRDRYRRHDQETAGQDRRADHRQK